MQELITDEITDLKNQLLTVVTYMDNFEENHMKTPGNLTRMMASIKAAHSQMQKDYSKEALEKYNPELNFYIKQIAEKFDNMIEQKIVERDNTATAIRELVNRQKIAIYQR
ncbi:MAG: hypothetical protein V1720_10975 [bacterium]